MPDPMPVQVDPVNPPTEATLARVRLERTKTQCSIYLGERLAAIEDFDTGWGDVVTRLTAALGVKHWKVEELLCHRVLEKERAFRPVAAGAIEPVLDFLRRWPRPHALAPPHRLELLVVDGDLPGLDLAIQEQIPGWMARMASTPPATSPLAPSPPAPSPPAAGAVPPAIPDPTPAPPAETAALRRRFPAGRVGLALLAIAIFAAVAALSWAPRVGIFGSGRVVPARAPLLLSAVPTSSAVPGSAALSRGKGLPEPFRSTAASTRPPVIPAPVSVMSGSDVHGSGSDIHARRAAGTRGLSRRHRWRDSTRFQPVPSRRIWRGPWWHTYWFWRGHWQRTNPGGNYAHSIYGRKTNHHQRVSRPRD